jgi:transposase
VVTAGQAHESVHADRVLRRVRVRTGRRGRPRSRPARAAGDKGYSNPRVRRELLRRGIEPVIPHKADELARMKAPPAFDRRAYRKRNAVERCVGMLKESRRVATRYEKLAVNYQQMVELAMIRVCMKTYLSHTA